MDKASSFYLTLPSNASFDVFPDNKASHFKVKLAKPVHLEGNWEMALVEIHYPDCWKNVDEHSNKFSVNTTAGIIQCSIPQGHYSTAEEVIAAIRHELFIHMLNADDIITIKYLQKTKKFQMRAREGYSMKFHGGLAHILGVPSNCDLMNNKSGDRKVNLHRGVYALFVYTNIAAPQLVGDAYVPLLKIVDMEQNTQGDVINREYSAPHYIPLETKQFDTIEMYITADTGKRLSFEWGKVIAKVHFRRSTPYH